MAISIPLRADRRRSRVAGRWSGPWRIAVVASVLLVLGGGAVAVSRSALFHARDVEVSGSSHLSRAEVVRAVGISRRTNVLWLDEEAAERRLELEPWIAAADVRTVYPRRIEISVVERVPVAVVTRGDRRELIAADGIALGAPEILRGLPRIELPATPALDGARFDVRGAARALGAMSPELRAEVASVRVGIDGNLDLKLRDGTQVRYGPALATGRKAAALATVVAWALEQGERLHAISVVSADLPAVRLAE